MASAAGSSDLSRQLLPPRFRDAIYPEQKEALRVWSISHQEEPPSPTACSHQKAWDTSIVNVAYVQLLESAPDDISWACLLAAHTRESGAWLNTLPLSALGLRMDDDTVRIATGLRLGAPLCLPHVCHHCGAEVDNLGTHGLSCRKSHGRHPRHASINSLIQRYLSAAGIPAHLEPNGLCHSDGKRPDGVSIIPWSCGRVLVWDATCLDMLAPSHIALASREPGLVAEQAEQQRKAKYADLLTTHHFVPIGIETICVFGPEALSFFKELGRRLLILV